MYKWMMITGLALCAVTLTACSKKYGAGCEKETTLTEPWTGLGLPIDKEETRVCESSGDKLKLRSHAWNSRDKAFAAFDSALTSAGYAKDKCISQACYYVKDRDRIGVQPIEFKLKKKRLVTVILNRHETSLPRATKKKP